MNRYVVISGVEDPVELAKLLLDASTEFGELSAEEFEEFLRGIKEGVQE